MPPESAAARNGAGGNPMRTAAGTAMGIMIAKVPQLEPMENAIADDARKTRGRNAAGGKVSWATPAT